MKQKIINDKLAIGNCLVCKSIIWELPNFDLKCKCDEIEGMFLK